MYLLSLRLFLVLYICILGKTKAKNKKTKQNKELDTSLQVLAVAIKVPAFRKSQNAHHKIMFLLANKISLLLCAVGTKMKGEDEQIAHRPCPLGKANDVNE